MQRLEGLLRKAVQDYEMISPGDKIMVGVSGGKDSVALTVGLAQLRQYLGFPFEVTAVTLDPQFGGQPVDYSALEALFRQYGVPYEVRRTLIGPIVFDYRKEKNPCSLCAKMRKGALNDMAEQLGCNKIALGHNKDDVVETFFMSLLYEGRLNCFAPVSFLDRKKLYSIRPLMYVPEWECRSFVNKSDIHIVKNPCLADGNTKRQETKELLAELSLRYDNLQEKVFGAIKRSSLKGWNHEE